MSRARRPKQPEKVRRALLDAAARIAARQGFAGVTVEAVCRDAGVTKGAFFHHYPTKAALADAVTADLLARFAEDLTGLVEADPDPHGRFTRAYLTAVSEPGTAGSDPVWAAVFLAAFDDPALQACWGGWLSDQMARHGEPESNLTLRTVRLAADGLWVADMAGSGQAPDERRRFLAHLEAMTRHDGGP